MPQVDNFNHRHRISTTITLDVPYLAVESDRVYALRAFISSLTSDWKEVRTMWISKLFPELSLVTVTSLSGNAGHAWDGVPF